MGIEIPEAHGGAGASFFHAVLAVEALSSVDPSVGVLVDVQNTLVANALMRWGTDDLKHRYLPQLAARVGRRLCAVRGRLRQRRVCADDARGRGGRRVPSDRPQALDHQRRTRPTSSSSLRRCNPDAGYKGITAFVVERGAPGFSIGKKEDKLGIRASSTCELLLEDCRVSRANVLGEVGRGYKVAIETLNEGRIGIGAQMIGLAQGALDHAIAYTKERKQFGKAIADFQGVQFQLARAATELRRRGCSSTTPRACATAASRSSRPRRCASCSRPTPPSTSRRSRFSCSAATATSRTTLSRSCIAMRRSARSTKARRTCSCRRSRKRYSGA